MTIHILPARLANQIAAGEVVERPASVVKELVENSLDAGSSRIEVDIEKGGSKLIRVFDNGTGIDKDELTLALSRHATSKISTLDDLEAIMSLGFRGEALASISSVSRLTLTSRTEKQAQAWAAFSEGREMQVKLKPAAHPVGSTVEVLDLFFNTPARRKFLRTEKTEFTHIDELLKRIALSRFDVSIILRHNGAMVRQYQAAISKMQKNKRLSAICGSNFAKDAVEISLQHQGLSLEGWICTPQGARAQNDIQHCFVNGRMMKDKLINHAIRQGYEASLQPEKFAAYVLYIEIAPQQVDVNVHPAKHEVRFHQARLVHDFIYQVVRDSLEQVIENREQGIENNDQVRSTSQSMDFENSNASNFIWQPQKSQNYSSDSTSNSHSSSNSSKNEKQTKKTNLTNGQPPPSSSSQNQKLYQELLTVNSDVMVSTPEINEPNLVLGKALAVVSSKFLLLQQGEKIQLLDLNFASYLVMLAKLQDASNRGLQPQPLLIPQKLNISTQEMVLIENYQPLLQKFGIILQQKNASQILIMSVCQPLRETNLQKFFNELLVFMSSNSKLDSMSIENMSTWLAAELMVKSEKFSLSQSIGLISELENCWRGELVAYYSKLLRTVDVTSVINSFKDD